MAVGCKEKLICHSRPGFIHLAHKQKRIGFFLITDKPLLKNITRPS